jgi:ferredoxin
MKVKIIDDECTGCEECVEAVPDVFEMTEDGELAKVKVETVPSELEDDVEQQAEDCPAEAIVVE